MCKQHKLPTPKIDRNGLPPLKLADIPPPRVPPLPDQLGHVTAESTLQENDIHMDADSEARISSESEELLKIRELQELLSDPSNYTKIVAEPERKAGITKELAEMVKEDEIILERIDQQLLELGPFAKDTFLSPPTIPKDEPFPITFMPPSYLGFPPPAGMELPPVGARNRRSRGGRGPPPSSSMHQPPLPLMNNKTKRNSRGSETGSASSPMASTPIELRMELESDMVRERDTASPSVTAAAAAGAKEPPKSKWRKVGSAGTVTKPPLQSRSSSDRLHQRTPQSPVLDGFAVLSPSMPSSLPAVASPIAVSASPPTSSFSTSKTHHSSSVSSASIIPPASEVEMQSIFSTNSSQWDLVESPPRQRDRDSRERDLSSTSSVYSHSTHHHNIPGVHGRASSERGDSPLTQNISINLETGAIDRHHPEYFSSSRSNRDSRGSPAIQVSIPQHGGAPDPIPRPLSRPHSHSSSPPTSHHPHHPHQTPPPLPSHFDIHAPSLTSATSGGSSEIARHIVVSGGMPVTSRPNFSVSHFTSSRESHNSSPLVTSAITVSEERSHANSVSPLSEHSTRSLVQRSSASPSLGGTGGMGGDAENPLVDNRGHRRRNSSTSSYRSGRLHSFDEGQQQRSSPHATKPPPPLQSNQPPAHGGHHSLDPKLPPSGGGETKVGTQMNPYLWGAAGQFPPPAAAIPAPGQVIDPASVSSTAVPRFPFGPAAAAAAPFLPGANWISAPGGMIAAAAAAAPGLPPVRPTMPLFDPNSPYKAPFLSAPFLAQYRYSLPPAQGLKGFPGLAGVSAGSSPGTSSHPGTPTATIAMPFSYPGIPSGSALSAFKSLNDPSVSNRLSPPIIQAQQLLQGKDDNKQSQPLSAGTASGELPSQPVSMDKLPGLGMMQPPTAGSAATAAALMAAGTNINLMPYLHQMPFSIGGIPPPPATIGQQTPGGGVNLFNPRLSTLAAAGVHTGSEGNLTALGGSSKEAHRAHQRRGSAASIDVTGLSSHNESPPNQAKKGFPLNRSDTPAAPGGGGNKWKPVTEHSSPPVSQMLFNMSASPSSSPFAPGGMMDARTLPNSSHLMTSSLGQMLPLSFGTPPTHQQMRGPGGGGGGGKGTAVGIEGPAGRGSPRGTPDKMKLRIHQVKNDDFKMQSKPDRRRRRWKNKSQEIINIGPEPVVPSPPPSGKQTASQLRRVRSDTARKTSSTPPSVPTPDDKDEVVDVGDSSDNNYALNMLATMSSMQSREQNPLSDTTTSAAKTISASPLTISTSVPSSEPSKNPLMHSPVSLAGAKSLLMLGKGDAHLKEEGAKSDAVGSERMTEEVTNVESTAVDSLLQLSGAMLKRNITKPSAASSGNRNESSEVDSSREDDSQRRSASYSAAEAMLMMGTTSSKEPSSVAEGNNRQSPPQEVFSNSNGNGSGQEKQPSGREKGENTVPQKPSNLSKIPPRSLTISAEANDSDSEATLTPPTPAKRLPSLSTSSVDVGMEQETTSGADSGSGTELKQSVGEPSPPSATIPDALERTCEESTPNVVPESSASMAQIEEKSSTVEASLPSSHHQPSTLNISLEPQSTFASKEEAPPTSAVSAPAPDLSAASNTVSDSSHDVSSDHDIDDDLPPSKRLKLATEDKKEEEEREVQPKPEHEPEPVFNEASPVSQPDAIERHDEFESSLKQNTEVEETHASEAFPVVQDPSSLDDNQLTMKVQEDDKVADSARSPPSLVQEEAMNTEAGSPEQQPSDKVEAAIDEGSREDDDILTEPAKPSPPSTDGKVTSWSAFADVAQASYEEREQQQQESVVAEKACESDVKTSEETASSPPSSPPPPMSNKNVEKLKVDVGAKPSNGSSVSSPPFTPDPPIEVDVFENLPPTPKLASKALESEEIPKESHTTNHSDFSSSVPDKDKDKEQVQQSSGVTISTSSDSSSVNSISVSGGPQNRLVVNRPSPNRLQHRKHVSHSSKLGKDGKTESRKRARPPPDSQMRLFEVDTVSMTTTSTTSTTSATTPLAHAHTHVSHSSTKEKKVNSEKASREDSHQQDDRHSSSVRKLKKLGHSSSKSSLSGQKQSKHSTAGKHL